MYSFESLLHGAKISFIVVSTSSSVRFADVMVKTYPTRTPLRKAPQDEAVAPSHASEFALSKLRYRNRSLKSARESNMQPARK